jgi:hypothetical protein
MDFTTLPIMALVVGLLIMVAFFVIVRGFKMPKGFFEKEKKREAIRMRLMERELEAKEDGSQPGEEPNNGAAEGRSMNEKKSVK